MEERTQRRRDTIVEHAKTRNAHEKCKNSEIASKTLRWWEASCCSDDATEALQESRAVSQLARASSTRASKLGLM